MTKVVAFDPGETTGFAVGSIIDGLMSIKTGQYKFSHLKMWNELHSLKPDIIVYERFEFRNRARQGLILYSRELIGIFELYAALENIEIYKQPPGTVINGYFSNAKLKGDKLYKPGKIHSNEACMHLLYWYSFGSGYKYNEKGYKPE